MKTEAKLWTLEGEQGFKDIWPSDLVSDPTWPIFELDWDTCNIKSNILLKYHEDWSKTVASSVNNVNVNDARRTTLDAHTTDKGWSQ